jgi:hypothetical protein
MRSHSLNLLTANCLQQRFAIAPLQLPQTSFFNEPQRHRGHREREIAPPQPPKQRSHPSTPQKRSHSLTPQTAIAPFNLPNSDSYGALRYRTPSTPQKRSHPLNFPKAIAPPQPPKQRSHSLNFPKAIASPQLPQTAIAPLQLPKHPFLTNHRDTEDTEKERSHPLNSPTSFFNEPRRSEEHEGRGEERVTPSAVSHFQNFQNCFLDNTVYPERCTKIYKTLFDYIFVIW